MRDIIFHGLGGPAEGKTPTTGIFRGVSLEERNMKKFKRIEELEENNKKNRRKIAFKKKIKRKKLGRMVVPVNNFDPALRTIWGSKKSLLRLCVFPA
jgi:hypothetical protein